MGSMRRKKRKVTLKGKWTAVLHGESVRLIEVTERTGLAIVTDLDGNNRRVVQIADIRRVDGRGPVKPAPKKKKRGKKHKEPEPWKGPDPLDFRVPGSYGSNQ